MPTSDFGLRVSSGGLLKLRRRDGHFVLSADNSSPVTRYPTLSYECPPHVLGQQIEVDGLQWFVLGCRSYSCLPSLVLLNP